MYKLQEWQWWKNRKNLERADITGLNIKDLNQKLKEERIRKCEQQDIKHQRRRRRNDMNFTAEDDSLKLKHTRIIHNTQTGSNLASIPLILHYEADERWEVFNCRLKDNCLSSSCLRILYIPMLDVYSDNMSYFSFYEIW